MHPLAKTLARSQRESIDALTGRRGGATIGIGWPPAAKARTAADKDHEQQRADEEVGGDEEGGARVLDPAHVDQREDKQDGKAERERVGFEPGEGRDQRAHTGGDADGRVENVVDHQRRGGQQAGVGAEVLRRDRVAAAAVGVGVDGLQVGDEDNNQQADDGEANGYDVRECPRGQGG